MKIEITREYEGEFSVEAEELAVRAAEEVLRLENCKYEVEISLLLCDNESIREINREMRGIDAATDVLSFPAVDFPSPCDYSVIEEQPRAGLFDPDTDRLMLGDIVLSLDRVKEQAAEYGHSREREFAFLIVHSMLHLLGYDHMEDADRERMEEEQKRILESLGISR